MTMTRITLLAVLGLLLGAAAGNGQEAEERIMVDQAFLKSHAEAMRVQTIAKGDFLFPFLHLDVEFFRGHIKTWANIKSKSGELVLAVPLDYNTTTDGKTKILIFQYSKTHFSPESVLELNFRREEKEVVYVIPFTLFTPDKTFDPGR
jgi:hypothetical protein